jgi:hypothetical protein
MNYKFFKYLLLYIISCFFAFFHPANCTNLREEEVALKAHTQLFHEYLMKIKQDLENLNFNPTIFICYAGATEIEDTPQFDTFAYDLLHSGIKKENLYYKLGPGGGVTIHQHASRIFNVDKVIVVGSSKLKEDYEKRQGGRGHTTQVIENLSTRINREGTEGIIPLWFQGKFEECFPLTFASLPHQYLGKDYFTSFFDLLANLYALSSYDNFILKYKTDFDRQRGVIPQDMLARYGEQLLLFQQEQVKKDREELEKCLFNSIDKKEGEQDQERPIKPLRLWQPITSDPFFFPLNNLPDRPEEFIESKPDEGSRSYLDSLWQELHKERSATISALGKSSIAGMGGLGKTTLALQYAHEALAHKAYHLIYWLYSETEDSLIEGYKSLLHALTISFKEEDKKETIIQLIKQHLPTKGRSLLIYDNVPEPKSLLNKTPQAGVDILITSRCNQGWGKSIINLDVFRPQEAVDYLLRTINLEASEENQHQVGILAQELGYLPLALSHAASYIKYLQGGNKNYGFADYLKEFRECPEEHFEKNISPFDENHKNNIIITHEYLIAKTWALSGKIISPFAKQLMTYFAYLEPDMIDSEIFKDQAKSDKNLIEAMSQLRAFSLIKQNEGYFSIHRLLQLVIRQELETSQINNLESTFIALLLSFSDFKTLIEHNLKYLSPALENLKKFYEQGFILNNHLKTFINHLHRLSLNQRIKDFYVMFTCVAFQRLFDDFLQSLRNKLFTQWELIQDEQRKELEPTIVKAEFEKRKLILNSYVISEITEFLPILFSFELYDKATIYLATVINELSKQKRKNFVNNLKNLLLPIRKNHYRSPNALTIFERMESEQLYDFVLAVQLLLNPVSGDKWDKLPIIKSFSKVNPLYYKDFVETVAPLMPSKISIEERAQIIKGLSKVGITELQELIVKAQTLKLCEILKEDLMLYLTFIYKVDSNYWLEFIESIQPLFSSETKAIEKSIVLSKIQNTQWEELRDFIRSIQLLFIPERTLEEKKIIVKAMNMIKPSERLEFSALIQPLLNKDATFGGHKYQLLISFYKVESSKRCDFANIIQPLFTKEMDDLTRSKIIKALQNENLSELKQFVEVIRPLFCLGILENFCPHFIKLFKKVTPADRRKLVEAIQYLITQDPEMKAGDKTSIVENILGEDSAYQLELIELVQSFLPSKIKGKILSNIIRQFSRVKPLERREFVDIIKPIIVHDDNVDPESINNISNIIYHLRYVPSVQRHKFVEDIQILFDETKVGDISLFMESLVHVDSTKRIPLVRKIQPLLTPEMDHHDFNLLVRAINKVPLEEADDFMIILEPLISHGLAKQLIFRGGFNFEYFLDIITEKEPAYCQDFVRYIEPLLTNQIPKRRLAEFMDHLLRKFNNVSDLQNLSSFLNIIKPFLSSNLDDYTVDDAITRLLSFNPENRIGITKKFMFIWNIYQGKEEALSYGKNIFNITENIFKNYKLIEIISIINEIPFEC